MGEKMNRIKTPNLPEKEVVVCVSAVDIQGVTCIKPKPIPTLPLSMQMHADLQLCHLGENVLLAAPETYAYYNEMLSPFGYKVLCGKTPLGSTYPMDAAYNIARVGNAAFHNPKITDPVALSYFKENGISLIPVKQGYAKCALLPLDTHTIVTSDDGIKKEAEKNGFSVLHISPGGVLLSGFPYGFLGGAGGKLSPDTMYITGSLSAHTDREKILAFFEKKSIKIREGSIPNPVDIGSIVPLLTA